MEVFDLQLVFGLQLVKEILDLQLVGEVLDLQLVVVVLDLQLVVVVLDLQLPLLLPSQIPLVDPRAQAGRWGLSEVHQTATSW